MSMTEFSIEHLSDFYDFASKTTIKGFVKENIGRFIEYEQSQEFFKKYHFSDIDKFSKVEKNLLYDTLKDNSYKDMILDYYNKNIDGLEIKNKIEFVKKLKTLGEFLKAVPYCDPSFQFKAYQSLIDGAINNEPGNFDVLIKGFNNYVEVGILHNFFANDPVEIKRAIEYINERDVITEELEKKSLTSTNIAGFMSLGLTGVLGGAKELSEIVMPKITGLVAHCAMAPTLINLSHAGIATLAFYKTFQIMNGVVHKIEDNAKRSRIAFQTTESLSSLGVAKDFLRNQLFRDILVVKSFNTQLPENQKYLDLLLFANEKLSDSGVELSENIIKKHNLSESEVLSLNSLDFDRIHQISNVKDVNVRKFLLLGTLEKEHEFFYKTVSDAMFLIGEKNSTVSLELPQIHNIPDSLTRFMDKILPESRKIMNSYLSVVVKKDGFCPVQDFKMIESCVFNYAENPVLLASILAENLQTKIKHYDFKKVKNKELDYVSRIANFIVGNTDERLTKNNDSVRSYILKEAKSNGFSELEKVVARHPSFLEKLSDKTVNVIYKIGEIRDKIKREAVNFSSLKSKI